MIKKLQKNPLYNVFSSSGIVVLGKVIASFVVSKVSAVYLGPAGYALLGNFKNVLQGVLGITTNGFQSGVIKHIAECETDAQQKNKVVTNALVFSFLISIVTCPFLLFYAPKLAVYTLYDIHYTYVFKYLSLFLPLISLWFIVLYIVNGLQKIHLYTKINILANCVNVILIFLFIYFFKLKGALIASIIIPALSFIISFVFKEIREVFFEVFLNFKQISIMYLKSFSVYIFMAIYSTLLISLSYLFIRNNIINRIDMVTAGLWEAMNKVSMFYMMFFTSLMTLHLLPKLSENKTVRGYYIIMKDYFKVVLPFAIISFIVLFFLKYYIIKLFLTEEFLEINQFFHLQLLGDLFKIMGFSLAYQFHAKKMLFCYFFTDAILYGVFYFLGIYLIEFFYLKGVFYAYLLSTFLYFLTVLALVIKTKHQYLKNE